MLELLEGEVLVFSELLSEELLAVLSALLSNELSPFSVEMEKMPLVVFSLEPSVVGEFTEFPLEFDKVGGSGTLEVSFEQAVSEIANATIEIILHSFFMSLLLWINRPYHLCGNAAHYRQRRNIVRYNSSCRDYCPIANGNSGKYCRI